MFYESLATRAWIKDKQFSKAKATPDKADMAEMTKKASTKAEGEIVKAKRALAEVKHIKTKMHKNKNIEAAKMA